MLRTFAILFGLILIAIGILGFLPDFAPEGLLFKTFLVNPVHNIIHLASGIIALVCGMSSRPAAKTFFILFGLAYATIAGLGFYFGEGLLFSSIAINDADNWLHTALAAVSLLLGFFVKG